MIYYKKIIIVLISMLLLSTGSYTVIGELEKKPDEYKSTIEIYNQDSDEKDIIQLDSEKTKEILNEFFKEIEVKNFLKDINEKLNILVKYDLINQQKANKIQQFFRVQKILSRSNIKSKGIFFDIFNFFNGAFFALKGERTRVLFDMAVYQFPFFENTSVTALFSGFSSYTGSGTVLSIGTLGFRFLYDFNMNEYEFPHFENINGWTVGFTGVLIKIDFGDELDPKYEGTYYLGIGMTVALGWNEG